MTPQRGTSSTSHFLWITASLIALVLLAAVVAFVPSFSFILFGGGRFERLRGDERARAFLDGAGPAAIGAILFGLAFVLVLIVERLVGYRERRA